MWYLSDLEQESTDLSEWLETARGVAVEIPFAGDFLDWLLEHLASFFSAAAERIHHLNDWADIIAAWSLEVLDWDDIKEKIEDVWSLTFTLTVHSAAIVATQTRLKAVEDIVGAGIEVPEVPEEKAAWWQKILGVPIDVAAWLFESIIEKLEGFLEERVDWVFEVGRRILIKLI